MTQNKKESRILGEVREAVMDMHGAGAIGAATVREFDALCSSQMEKAPTVTPQAELRAELNASLDAAITEAECVGYISCEEGDRRAEELLKRLDAEPADRPARTGLAARDRFNPVPMPFRDKGPSPRD